jgi:hypothetical protein
MHQTITPSAPQAGTVLALSSADIDDIPWRPVPGCPGIRTKDLWRSGDRHDALISYDPGATTPGPPHAGADHHIWLVSGSALVAGRRITAGSYVYVPPGTVHPITELGGAGCLLLQIHRPVHAAAA